MESKILIVDDEKSVIQQIKTLVESFGYKSFYIPRAQFLIKRLETENFDLILLDINMPGVDGITALKTLKSNEQYKDIPVIMMTGDTSDETLEACFDYGAADYITKPVSELVLKARVKSVIDKQLYLKEIFAKNEALLKSEHKIKVAHNNITASINYAKKIQAAVMPSKGILDEAIAENFVYLKPRDVVSGDFYWMRTAGDKIYIAAADCTGHGVPGAFLSILCTSLLNEAVHKVDDMANVEAGHILDSLRRKIKKALGQTGKTGEQKDGMDIALCIIDNKTKLMQFSGAHNPAYIVRQKTTPYIDMEEYINTENDDLVMIEFKGDRQPIGVHLQERSFTTYTMQLEPNDLIYLFSDGFVDQTGGERRLKFMRKRFKEMLLEAAPLPLNEQYNYIDNTYINWKGDEIQVDDILVMGLKVGEL